MRAKQGATEPLQRRDTDNGVKSHPCRTTVRERIMGILVLVLTAAGLTTYRFHRSKLVETGSIGTWRWFWAFEVFICVWLISGVVLILRKRP